MKSFRFEINEMGDQAMDDNPMEEVVTLLKEVAAKITDGRTSGTLWDSNGNVVGEWWFADE